MALNLTSLEDVVAAATTINDSGKLASALKNFLKRDIAEHLLASFLPNDEDPLDVLDPKANTLGYLYILTARLEQPGSGVALVPAILNFCDNFTSTQLAYVPERVNAFVTRLCKQPNLPDLLETMSTLVIRYPFERDVLTAIHPTFLHACIKLRRYQTALPVLSVPMAQIDKSIYPITYLDNLLYHYYGAFVFIALKQWTPAEEYLEMVVSAPISSSIPSAIQMEAMKKLSLVQLIRHGQLKSLPKYVPQTFTKAIKQSAYGALAKVYPAGPVQQVAEKEQKAFRSDFNLGLLMQAVNTAPRWKLRTLTKTYLTLSIEEISKEIGMPNLNALRELVRNMIEVGEITATLENDTLTFIDEKPNFTPADVEQALREAQLQCQRLALLDQQVGRSKEFLQKALKERDSGGGGGGWGATDDADMAVWTEDLGASVYA